MQTTKTFKLGEGKQSYPHKIQQKKKEIKRPTCLWIKLRHLQLSFTSPQKVWDEPPVTLPSKKRQSGQCKSTTGSLGQGNQCKKEPCPGPYANRSTAST